MIKLTKAGDVAKLSLSKGGTSQVDKTIKVTLRWTAGVDLDLHAFGLTETGSFEHVYFANKGNMNNSPYMRLDQDAGVGNTAGDNEENLAIGDLSKYKKILFACNIFRFLGFLSSGDYFGKYDGSVIVQALGEKIEAQLNSKEKGKWALIALIDNSDSSAPTVKNINLIQKAEPTSDQVANL